MVGEKENKAMKRKEVVFKAKQAKVTPSRKEVLPKIAALLNAKTDTVVISSISHPFGETSAEIKVRAYDSPEAMKELESSHLVNRDLGKKGQEGKKAEPKQEKAEEKKPAENAEKKEKPSEEKKEKPDEKKAIEKKGAEK